MAINTSFDPKSKNEMSKSNLNFNGQKMVGTIPAASIGSIDITLTDDHLLTGASLLLSGNSIDDEVKFQIVMGTTVVNQFADWYAKDLDFQVDYPARIPAGITIRVSYKNTGTSSVKVRVNLMLHKILI